MEASICSQQSHVGAFPHGGKYLPQQQWVLMAMPEDAKSPYRYQQVKIDFYLRLSPFFILLKINQPIFS
jgi:hypothetical protein